MSIDRMWVRLRRRKGEREQTVWWHGIEMKECLLFLSPINQTALLLCSFPTGTQLQ